MKKIDSYDVDFNFVRFINFLKENNIVSVAIASVLSDRINEITNSFVNNMIMPIFDYDIDNDGKRDIKSLENKYVKIYGIKINFGNFVISILKFIIVTYLIFLISNTLNKYADQI